MNQWIKGLTRRTLVTPTIMFLMWVQMVRMQAMFFLLPNQMVTFSFLFLPPMISISASVCLNLRVSSPRGPLTVTTREVTLTVTALDEWMAHEQGFN